MQVIRIPETDQLKPVPKIRVRTFFILRNRLKESVLHDALDRLIRNHWRKLGARLATRREDRLLEYHLPQTFDENYELFGWTSERHEGSIDTVGLPKPTPPEKGLTLHNHIETLESRLSPSEWPLDRTMEPPGAPLLLVHLSLFDDASCLAINHPHVLADQFGLSNIIKAWLGVTKGETPPSMLGFDDDPLSNGKSYANYQRAEVVRKGRMRVRRKGQYPFVLMGFIPDLAVHRKEIKHTIFLPLPLVQSLHERHSKALVEKYGADARISENDIVSAIGLKINRMHRTSPQTLALSQSINLRGRIPLLQNENYNAFIHNSMHYSTARFRVGPSTALSEIAYQNRRALTQAFDQKDIEIGLTVTREMVRRGQPNHTCELFEESFHVTSWIAAWKGLDFGSACELQDKQETGRSPSELMVLGTGAPLGYPGRFVTNIVCKTSEGYWVNLSAPVKTIGLLNEFLKQDPLLERL